jgi:hypothetical protein
MLIKSIHHSTPAHLQGYSEVRYDEEKKRVVYEPLQLTQAYRCVDMGMMCPGILADGQKLCRRRFTMGASRFGRPVFARELQDPAASSST